MIDNPSGGMQFIVWCFKYCRQPHGLQVTSTTLQIATGT